MKLIINEGKSNEVYDDLYKYADEYRFTSRWTKNNVETKLNRTKKLFNLSDMELNKIIDKVNKDYKRKNKVKSNPYDENSYKVESVKTRTIREARYGLDWKEIKTQSLYIGNNEYVKLPVYERRLYNNIVIHVVPEETDEVGEIVYRVYYTPSIGRAGFKQVESGFFSSGEAMDYVDNELIGKFDIFESLNEEVQDNVAIIDFDKAELVSGKFSSSIIIPIIQDDYTLRDIELTLWGDSTWSWSVKLKGSPTIQLKSFHKVEFDVQYSREIDADRFIDSMFMTVSQVQKIIKDVVTDYFNEKFKDLVIDAKGKLKQDMIDDIVVLMAQYSNMKDSTNYDVNNDIYGVEKFDRNKYKNYNQYVEVKLLDYLDNLPNASIHLMTRQKLDNIVKDLSLYLKHKNIEATDKTLNIDGIRLKGYANDIARDYIKSLFNKGWEEITPDELDNININKVYKADTIYGVIAGSSKDIKTKSYSTNMGHGSLSSTTIFTPHIYVDNQNNILVNTTSVTWD